MSDHADRWPRLCLSDHADQLCMEPFGHYGNHYDRDGNEWPNPMSEQKFGKLRKEPTRSWKTSDDDSPMRCYLGMEGRVTLCEIFDHFKAKYPHVNPLDLQFNFATVVWDEPPTPDDVAKRQRQRAEHAARTEHWERETLERLTAKYAGER